MAVVGKQDFWVAGARMWFKRTGQNAWIDLGVTESMTPNFELENVTLQDSRLGVKKVVLDTVVSFTESYEFTLADFNPSNLALIYNATGTLPYTQSPTPVTDVVHVAALGGLVKILDSSGVPVHNLASIQKVTLDDDTDLTKDTDWFETDLLSGFIELAGTIAGLTEGDNFHIDYTLNEITDADSVRKIRPQSAGGSIQGEALIEIGRDGTIANYRHCDISLSIGGVNFDIDNPSTWTLNATVLSDTSNATEPAGTLIQPVGATPA